MVVLDDDDDVDDDDAVRWSVWTTTVGSTVQHGLRRTPMHRVAFGSNHSIQKVLNHDCEYVRIETVYIKGLVMTVFS